MPEDRVVVVGAWYLDQILECGRCGCHSSALLWRDDGVVGSKYHYHRRSYCSQLIGEWVVIPE